MDMDFFDEQGETVYQTQEQSSSNQYENHQEQYQDNADDDFDFAQPVQSSNIQGNQYSSFQEEDEGTRRIREEEQRIQEALREKANLEYEEKMKRKEAGRQQLEDFLERKEREKAERREQNLESQRRTREETKKLNDVAGWSKVAANVPLKQGEHPGSKDTTRMRQAIINKKSDESK